MERHIIKTVNEKFRELGLKIQIASPHTVAKINEGLLYQFKTHKRELVSFILSRIPEKEDSYFIKDLSLDYNIVCSDIPVL